MKNLKKYGCYTLLAVAVFAVIWLICGFIAMNINILEWGTFGRFVFIVLSLFFSCAVISNTRIK
tara:strand:+ start:274 stop:465 length:192 start_codon:yes stop_codon:yes gene_type:complete